MNLNSSILSIGDEIEFNSDPDEDDQKSHIQYGIITNLNNKRKQVSIKRMNNNQQYTYFMDEIHIKKLKTLLLNKYYPEMVKPNNCGRSLVENITKLINKFTDTDCKWMHDPYQFMENVAVVESNWGNNPNTFTSKRGGIWQVTHIGYDASKDIHNHSNLKKKHQSIQKYFGINWINTEFKDLKKPIYSYFAARLYLSNIKQSIPNNINQQAIYWKYNYNKAGQKGLSVQQFINKVKEVRVIK